MSESGNGNLIAPYYDDDSEAQQIVTSAIGASGLPNNLITYATQQVDAQEGEVVIGGRVIDRSGSMDGVWNQVIEGMRLDRKVLTTSHERRKMQVRTLFVNDMIQPWEPHGPSTPFLSCVEGDPSFMPEITNNITYPDGMTAIYRGTLQLVSAVDVFARSLEQDQGYDVRRVIQVVTDGFDNQSSASELAQLRAFVEKRRIEENWTFILFGIIDPDIVRYVGDKLGHPFDPNDVEFADRIFRCVACGGDPEMERTIKSVSHRTELGGMGFNPNMVMSVPMDPDKIRDLYGVKLSSTFIKASSGKIHATVPIAAQTQPDPSTSASASFV